MGLKIQYFHPSIDHLCELNAMAKIQCFIVLMLCLGGAFAAGCTKKQDIQYKGAVLNTTNIGGSNPRPKDPIAFCQEQCG